MNTEIESLTIRLPAGMKLALEEKARGEDLTVSQLVRRHFAALLTRRVSAATDSAARRVTPRKPARRGKKEAA